jgi:AraC-like DNA-binding protein
MVASPNYTQFAPSALLFDHIACYWSRCSSFPVSGHTVVPDNCVDLIVQLGGSDAGFSRGMFLTGMMTRPLFVSRSDVRSVFGIRFKPGGVQAFLRLFVGHFQDERPPAADLWPDAGKLQDALLHARDDAERCQATDRFLLSRIKPDRCDKRIMSAVSMLETGATTIGAVATRLNLSRQRLHALFLENVGLSPKVFGRVARFQRAVRLIRTADESAASIASEAGYSDQAHMIREFRVHTGATPATLA